MRLAIITTHPIQYNAPLFAMLAKESSLQVKIFYTWPQAQYGKKFDPGFGKVIDWDIPLLNGYEYCFVDNTSANPGSDHFRGIVNPTLNSEIEKWNASAVLVYGWAFSSHLKCIRYFYKKKKVLFRGDSTLLDEKKSIKTFFRRLALKWVYKHIDYALYVGKNNKAYFLKHGLKENQLVYAPHAIDNKRFDDSNGLYKIKAAALRKDFGFSNADVVLLFAGKFEQKKNPFFIINFLKKIKNKKLKVLFVGNGTMEQSLKAEAANDERIHFIGFQNQSRMPVVYRAADIFILPSSGPGETWGLAMNEAMASGRTVAASNKAGGAGDLLENGYNGLIFNHENPEALITLIEKALIDKSVLAEMGSRSIEKINQFSFENIVQSIVKLAEKL